MGRTRRAARPSDDLGPDRLMRQSAVVMRLGQLLQSCGAGSYRIKASMARVAAAVGLDRHEALVTLTEITTTSYAGDYFRTEVSEHRQVGTNAHRLDELGRLVARVRKGTRVEEVEAELDRIAALAPLYPWWINALAAGLACAGFTYLNGGTWLECLVVVLATSVGQLLRRAMLERRLTHFAVWLAAGFTSATIYVTVVGALQAAQVIDTSHHAGVVSTILFLMPGFPLVTVMLDLLRHDFSSALSRAAYVLTVMTATGLAIGAATSLFHWDFAPPAETGGAAAPLAVFALRALASFAGAYGVALLFNSPQKVALTAGVVGALANPARLAVVEAGWAAWHVGVGAAAFGIGILATMLSARSSYSRVTLSVPAIVIMIPGAPFYFALSAFDAENVPAALDQLATIALVIGSIGIGLALSRIVTDPGWRRDTATSTLPQLRDL
ncbi:threonine/serine ThrE exporter family protein [Buchananella hordeovulneris]|uniref:threonine/serine ThrE exporter family protein n=1 Tax=Buchananella hordeovulneris TaxID=52770 RepID=UPI001FED7141|nr:threonine/serine exporter family protein [Buchananella hordeovulneris]